MLLIEAHVPISVSVCLHLGEDGVCSCSAPSTSLQGPELAHLPLAFVKVKGNQLLPGLGPQNRFPAVLSVYPFGQSASLKNVNISSVNLYPWHLGRLLKMIDMPAD